MNLLERWKKRNSPPQGIQRVRLEKQTEGVYRLLLAPGRYYNRYLWDYLQRDVILALLSGLFVMLHLDGFAPFGLDDDLEAVCPCTSDEYGKTYLLAGEGLLRLVTELLNVYGEYWDFGEPVNLSAFTEPPALEFPADTDVRALPGYVLGIRPVGDDLGFEVEFEPQRFPEEELLARVQQVAAGYRVLLDET